MHISELRLPSLERSGKGGRRRDKLEPGAAVSDLESQGMAKNQGFYVKTWLERACSQIEPGKERGSNLTFMLDM